MIHLYCFQCWWSVYWSIHAVIFNVLAFCIGESSLILFYLLMILRACSATNLYFLSLIFTDLERKLNEDVRIKEWCELKRCRRWRSFVSDVTGYFWFGSIRSAVSGCGWTDLNHMVDVDLVVVLLYCFVSKSEGSVAYPYRSLTLCLVSC